MASAMNHSAAQTCAACGFQVFAEPAPGTGKPCPVCGWLDDFEQLVHPDLVYGANSGRSLREAQASALISFPASALQHGDFARDPLWRPLRAGETPPTEEGAPASPVCYISTPDPANYAPYWLRPRGR
jgi:hypothetical protein